jgi:hypothetical protein
MRDTLGNALRGTVPKGGTIDCRGDFLEKTNTVDTFVEVSNPFIIP